MKSRRQKFLVYIHVFKIDYILKNEKICEIINIIGQYVAEHKRGGADLKLILVFFIIGNQSNKFPSEKMRVLILVMQTSAKHLSFHTKLQRLKISLVAI